MNQHVSQRRSFMSCLGASLAAVGVGAVSADAQTPKPGAAFGPTRHAADDWLERVPGKHRMVIDAVTPHGAGEAILFANNLYVANKDAYALGDADLAIVIVMRHFATPFAFNDVVWAKYGKMMGDMVSFKDPKTKESPATNVFNSAAYGMTLPNLGSTLDSLIKRGTQFAVCDAATHFFSAQLAGMGGGTAGDVYKDLTSNTVANSRMVSAGVVGVTRAQERGYALVYAG